MKGGATLKELKILRKMDELDTSELTAQNKDEDLGDRLTLITILRYVVQCPRGSSSDDPIAEEVLEWTIEKDARDIAQIMHWLEQTKDAEIGWF